MESKLVTVYHRSTLPTLSTKYSWLFLVMIVTFDFDLEDEVGEDAAAVDGVAAGERVVVRIVAPSVGRLEDVVVSDQYRYLSSNYTNIVTS